MPENPSKVLEQFPYYDEIMNAGYHKSDFLTEKIIQIYQEAIFSVHQETLDETLKLDQVVYEYISSKPFYTYVQNYYLEKEDTVLEDVHSLLDVHQQYVEEHLKNINPTKWI